MAPERRGGRVFGGARNVNLIAQPEWMIFSMHLSTAIALQLWINMLVYPQRLCGIDKSWHCCFAVLEFPSKIILMGLWIG